MFKDRVRVLGFDVFGTVVDWRTSVARECQLFFDRHQIDVDPPIFADSWRSLYQPAMEPCRRGVRPYTRLDILHREMLEMAMVSHKIDPNAYPAEELDELALAWRKLDPWSDSIEGLQRLKKRYVVVPVSNGNIALLLQMAKRAGLPWDSIMGSELTQSYKPSESAYLGTADILGIKPSELCLVAAHNDDLAAAQKFGLATAFVCRKTEHGPHQKVDLEPKGNWDYSTNSILELAEKLDC